MKNYWLFFTLIAAFLLISCNKEDERPIETEEDEIIEETPLSWGEQITVLAVNLDTAADKFYALEKYMLDYKATPHEINLFKAELLSSYKDGNYLAEPTNDELMLTRIFQSYIIENHMKESEWKQFAFDYFQNVKNVYRAVDVPGSDAVKANEQQMNAIINHLQ